MQYEAINIFEAARKLQLETMWEFHALVAVGELDIVKLNDAPHVTVESLNALLRRKKTLSTAAYFCKRGYPPRAFQLGRRKTQRHAREESDSCQHEERERT
jgi:hypothetical protein